ncbi:MAG: aminoacyl-tRNA hydrolase [Bacilli bacterium]|nr:aminoacyl-tRNA hydrolase [Bacilli bacterium]
MKLIVGLGNPGKEYENTRHNIGFSIIDRYVSSKDLGRFKLRDQGLFLKSKLFEEDVLFLKPQSYMNLSGEVVRKYLNFYKISIDDLFVISDDLDLLIGNFKLRSSGSSGGHNGLKNIQLHIGTDQYKRLKIGISNRKDMDTKDYVLGKFSKEELEVLDQVALKVGKILDDYFKKDFSTLMNEYNRKNR